MLYYIPAGLEAVGNGAENVANLRTHQDQDGDDDDGNQRDDEGVFDQSLSTLRRFSCPGEKSLHDKGRPPKSEITTL